MILALPLPLLLLAALVLATARPTMLHAEPRHALVMGAWDYADPTFPPLPEKGGKKDVEGMRKVLEGLGFKVTVVTNPSLAQARVALYKFSTELKKRPGTALFYFNGHIGGQDGTDYLIPTGTSIAANQTLDDVALDAGQVLGMMREGRGAVNIMLLDGQINRWSDVGAGMTSPAAAGSFIGYAIRDSATALRKGTGRNTGSPYTAALVKHLATAGWSIEQMHTRVVEDVRAAHPPVYVLKHSGLTDDYHFRKEAAPRAPGASSGAPQAGSLMEIPLPGGEKMTFCYCPAGSFTMGSPAAETYRTDDEQQVPVRLSQGYWMARTEVTQGQWEAVMGSNPSQHKEGKELPVEQVSWEEAQGFIAKLNGVAELPPGLKLSLPTEAQWEYACRAGTETAFAFGQALTAQRANYKWASYPDPPMKGSINITNPLYARMKEKRESPGRTLEAGSLLANAWGLHDMHGNVWEWCQDAWDGSAKHAGGTDPVGTHGGRRVCRGGSWGSSEPYCRSANRDSFTPGIRNEYLGLRVTAVPAGQ